MEAGPESSLITCRTCCRPVSGSVRWTWTATPLRVRATETSQGPSACRDWAVSTRSRRPCRVRRRMRARQASCSSRTSSSSASWLMHEMR